jgi:hypothetical protein
LYLTPLSSTLSASIFITLSIIFSFLFFPPNYITQAPLSTAAGITISHLKLVSCKFPNVVQPSLTSIVHPCQNL